MTRFDVRTEKEFKKEIVAYHKQESLIALRLCLKIYNETHKWATLTGAGNDFTGRFIKNDSQVTIKPDYILDGREVEITCSKTICNKVFHEKCGKIESMLKNSSEMVFVNGIVQCKTPEFIWLNSEQWKPYIEMSKEIYGIVPMMGGGKTGIIGKDAYRFSFDWFYKDKQILPAITNKDKFPKEYADIVKVALN